MSKIAGELRICSRCIYDERVPRITFDADGVCNYCKMSDELATQYKTGTPEGEKSSLKSLKGLKRKEEKRNTTA